MPSTILMSIWGDKSHFVAPLGLATSLRRAGARVVFVGQGPAWEFVARAGFAFIPLPPVGEINAGIRACLNRVNAIRHRADSGKRAPRAVRASMDQLVRLRLDEAADRRSAGMREIFDRVRPDLVLWDPTEAAAPTVAAERGVQHICLSFVVRPRVASGDWWCALTERWLDLMRRTQVEGAVHDQFGNELSFVPPAYAIGQVEPGIRTSHVVIPPDESMFTAEPPAVDARTALVVLSTAYSTGGRVVRQLLDQLAGAGYAPMIVGAASRGTRALRGLDVPILGAVRVSALAGRCGVVVCCAGINTVLTAIDVGASLLCVPTRVHAYWEVFPAANFGAVVVPADRVDSQDLADSLSGLQPCQIDRLSGARPADSVAEELVEAIRRG